MKENILKKYNLTLMKGKSPNFTITGVFARNFKSIYTDGIILERPNDGDADLKIIGASVTAIVENIENKLVGKLYTNKHVTESDIIKICGGHERVYKSGLSLKHLPNINITGIGGVGMSTSNIDNLVFEGNDIIKTDGHIYDIDGIYVRNASYAITGSIRFLGFDVNHCSPIMHMLIWVDFDKANNATAKNIVDDIYIMSYELNRIKDKLRRQ